MSLKKYIIAVLIIISVLVVGADSEVHSHPIDMTTTTIIYEEDTYGEKLAENQFIGRISSNWLQIVGIVDKDVDPELVAPFIEENSESILQYIKSNISISNNGAECEVFLNEVPYKEESELFLSGYILDIVGQCDEKLSELRIMNTLFYDKSPMQKNYITIYKGSELKFDLLFTEGEPENIILLEGSVSRKASEPESKTLAELNASKKGFFDSDSLISRVSSYIESGSFEAQLLLLVVVFLIGGLHALEGGHSKTVLASLVVEGSVTVKNSLIYLLIFTISHMSDIFIFGLIIILFGKLSVGAEILSNVAQYAGWLMLLLSLYMLFRATNQYYKEKYANKSDVAAEAELKNLASTLKEGKGEDLGISKFSNKKYNLMIALLSGLAPCLTGWAILILLVQSELYYLILPSAISFGLGVFVVLALFILVVFKLKSFILTRFSRLTLIAPIISAIILLIVSIGVIK